MKDFPSLSEFLIEYGVHEQTPKEEINELKKTYRKLYQKDYQQKRKTKEKRLENRLSPKEVSLLRKYANSHQRKHLSRFLKESAFAYLQKEYLTPNPEMIREISILIRRIGTNVNQIVQVVHGLQAYHSEASYKKIKSRVDELHEAVMNFLKKPIEITPVMAARALKKYIKQKPEHYQYLLDFVLSINPNKQEHDN